jgi:uncharacterized protein YlxW (UPF0749 family)
MITNPFRYFSLILISALLGYGIVSQVKIKAKIQEVIDPKRTSAIALDVGELIKNNRKLLAEQKELQEQMDKLTSRSVGETEEAIEQELERLKIVAGVTKVQGPGVEISIKEFMQTIQLVDLLNALRNIGAEAISFNGQRIVGSTGIQEDDFFPPYLIKVIGESHILENALTRKGGVIEQIGVVATVKIVNSLEIAAR